MTEWHRTWQKCFGDNIELPIGNRIADAIVNDYVLEFQHSRIPKSNIDERTKNHIDCGKKVLWILDCSECLDIKQKENSYVITFTKDTWKYENFICNGYIYLDTNDKIYRINPQNVKSCMIEVNDYKTRTEFINAINDDMFLWNNKEIEHGVVYHNQRGAGCGKTFESIQLLQNEEKFKHKETFIYLTKVHSAKEVIYNELIEQYKRGLLINLKKEENYDDNSIDSKQYKIEYTNKITNKNIQVIIGTIDSFAFAVGDKQINDRDYFGGLIKSIKEGYINTSKDGTINYARKKTKLNKNCLIIIDEAQDLGPEYIEAFNKIISVTGIDVYVIGDKLQSIWGEHNIHTFLEKNNLSSTIYRDKGKNHVMRFHNTQFKNFVNSIIDFEKYELPPINSICEGKECKYNHENEIVPYNVFEINTIYANDTDYQKIDDLIEKNIINRMEYDINKYNYLPHNFMFIFPILSKNALANRIESRLQDFWIKKFDDKDYQLRVLNNNNYWKDKINNNKFYKYVYLHKSDEGKSINLKESEYATRILSIHASKGNGCEVVFLLGISEFALTMFSGIKGNLVYDSLLHVALTRQKKSLYIGIEKKCDDIWQRFNKNCVIEKDITSEPIIKNISISKKYQNIIDFSFCSDDKFKKIYDSIMEPHECIKLLPENQDNKQILDWGHHIIRYAVLFYNIMENIMENENIDKNDWSDQFKTKLNKISKLKINNYLYRHYYQQMQQIDKNNRHKNYNKNYEIPVLVFETRENSKYYKYTTILISFMRNIQDKLAKNIKNNRLPKLCPLETVILLFMLYVYNDGQYSEISIMDIYSIMYCYDECSDSIDNNHSKECLCKEKFPDKNNSTAYNDIKQSIINHYEKVNIIKEMYNNYNKYITNNLGSSKFTYNIQHMVMFGNKNKNFKIYDKYPIIAYSDKHVIKFILRPQFNKLNFNKIIVDAIFDTFMLYNCGTDTENYNRYFNKKIIICILTLDLEQPIFCSFNINKDNEIIKNSIKDYLKVIYSETHDSIFDFYNFCLKTKPPTKDSISYTLEQLDNNYEKLPQYIKDYFHDIKREINDAKNKNQPINNIVVKVNNKEIFTSEINKYLDNAINDFLGNSDKDNEDCNY